MVASLYCGCGWMFHALNAPTTGGGSKPPFKTLGEKSQMIETALFGHVVHFRIAIPQKGNRPEHAQFHPKGSHGETKMLMEQAAEVTATTAKLHRKFLGVEGQKIISRKLLKNLDQVLLQTHKSRPATLEQYKLLSEDDSNNLQKMNAVIHVKLWRRGLNQTMALNREWAAGGMKLHAAQTAHEIL
jgi:hypothetical protein